MKNEKSAMQYVEKILHNQFHWKVRFGAMPVMLCDENTPKLTRRALDNLVDKGVLEYVKNVDGYRLKSA